jgi:hypothetical protein
VVGLQLLLLGLQQLLQQLQLRSLRAALVPLPNKITGIS